MQTKKSNLSAEALQKRYCRMLHRALACTPQLRKRLVAQMQESVADYLDENPQTTMQDLYEHFGEPKQVAENALQELDPKELQNQLKRARWRRLLVVLVLGAGIVFSGWYLGRLTINIIAGQFYFVEREPVILSDGPLPTDAP